MAPAMGKQTKRKNCKEKRCLRWLRESGLKFNTQPAAWVVRPDGERDRIHGDFKIYAASRRRVIVEVLSSHEADKSMLRAKTFARLGCEYEIVNSVGEFRTLLRELKMGRRARGQVTRADKVDVKPVGWALKGLVPSEYLTIVLGESGLGKSTMVCEWVARWTRGEMPGKFLGRPVTVMVSSLEDKKSQVVARLKAASADLSRVELIETRKGIRVPADIPYIAKEVTRTHARILVLDPLAAHLGREVHSLNQQSVRTLLSGLERLSEELGVSVILVAHPPKNGRGVSGSAAFKDAARSLVEILPHTLGAAEEQVRIMWQSKVNYAPQARPRMFKVVGCIVEGKGGQPVHTSKVEWLGDSHLTIEEILRPKVAEEKTALAEAERFLESYLSTGAALASEIHKAAVTRGHMSWRTVRRAKAALGVVTDKVKGEEHGSWSWRLPDPAQKPRKEP